MSDAPAFWPDPPLARERCAVWLATGLGIGLVVPAAGTIGGLWGVPLAWALGELNNGWTQCFVTAVLAWGAASLCEQAARCLGSPDPQAIVLDEIVALPLVFVGFGSLTWPLAAVGFVLFRVCDIAKPGPVRWAERLPGGWGIVLDDLGAALLAWVALTALVRLDGAVGWGWLA